MDLLTDLPKSEECDTIVVVINRLSKMSHFITFSKDLDAQPLANFLMRERVREYGQPYDIVAERGTLFTSDLWIEMT